MLKPEPAGEERVAYSGRIHQVLDVPMRIGEKHVLFERVRRSPGIRLLIVHNNKILLTREYRAELDAYDYRLPGGKVFDSLEHYTQHITQDILTHAETAARKECLEETGLRPTTINHHHISHAGATIEWDLHYFVVDSFEKEKQKLEAGEDIKVQWFTFEEAKKLCYDGAMHEDRSVGVLLRFLRKK